MRRLDIAMAADPLLVRPGESVTVLDDPLIHVAWHVTEPPRVYVMLLCRMPEGAGEWPRHEGWRRRGPAPTCLWCAAREGRCPASRE